MDNQYPNYPSRGRGENYRGNNPGGRIIKQMKSYDDILTKIKKTANVFPGSSRFVILKSNYYPYFEIS
jgi:hypothetical protein